YPLNTTEKDGTEPPKMAEVAQSFGLRSRWKENAELSELREALKRGETVILDLQAWRDDTTKAMHWGDDWEDGHYVVLSAMHDDYAYLMDPWVQGRYSFVSLRELQDRWHDEDPRKPGWRYQRLAVFVSGTAPAAAQSKDFSIGLARMR